jgi:ketosteroid isomerase-like protein
MIDWFMESLSFPLEAAFARQFAHEWIGAWNSHDIERILSHYADDIVLVSPVAFQRFGSSTIHGKAALRNYFQGGLDTYPDFRFDLIDVFRGVDTVALLYSSTFRSARTVEVMQLASSGCVTRVWANYNE